MGFLYPASLLFGLSLVALVLIYLRSRSQPTIEVSSLLLFEKIPAPVARSRILRLDRFFWLELLALTALTLAVAGLYMSGRKAVGSPRTHALIFDLGAGMGATSGNLSRLQAATQAARHLLSSAAGGERFSIIGYALEARTLRPATSRKDELLATLGTLRPLAVPVRPAALRAALLDARDAGAVDLFVDRAPSRTVIQQSRPEGHLSVHRFGTPADNVAIVSLDPGVPKSSAGHCVLRNFAFHPVQCELAIHQGGDEIFHAPLIIEPRAQAIVAFGPLARGGLVQAQILTPDALSADNQRYALAPSIAKAQVLVLSPDAEVRDDLARLVLAINPNLVVTAMDPAGFPGSRTAAEHFALALLHDCNERGVKAAARLFIFPEPRMSEAKSTPLLQVTGSVPLVELQSRENSGDLATPVLLGPSRIVAMPGWMDPLARGAAVGGHNSFALAGVGRNREGEIGLISFDIRNHLLLDPDRMDALVLTVDTLKRLLAPSGTKIVSTGSFVAVATFGPASITAPDGSTSIVPPDQWGRARFRPVEAGHYRVSAKDREVEVYANYYDAVESDVSGSSPSTTLGRPTHLTTAANGEIYLNPLLLPLIGAVMVLFLVESGLLARRASRQSVRHV